MADDKPPWAIWSPHGNRYIDILLKVLKATQIVQATGIPYMLIIHFIRFRSAIRKKDKSYTIVLGVGQHQNRNDKEVKVRLWHSCEL